MIESEKLYKAALKEVELKQPNIERTLELLNKSMLLGNASATYALGTWYLFGKHVRKNRVKGVKFIKQAADQNISMACYDMGVSYETGVGIKKDLKLAFHYYIKAALLGDKQAIYEVGRCYYYGIGVKKDLKLADLWLDTSAHFGIK